jgi:hypothetical protein
VGQYGPKFEAERDEILSQYLQERGQEISIFTFRLEASVYRKTLLGNNLIENPFALC